MFKKTSLDYFLFLRALACILVIRQHIGFPKFTQLEFLWIGHGNSGGLAVAAFFVLSGYLITKVLITKYGFNSIGILNFYVGRFARIVPFYYLITALTLFFVFPYPIQGIVNNPDYQKYLFQLLTFTYIGGLPYWNQVYWVISLEVFLYLLSPIFAFLINQISRLNSNFGLICGFLSSLLLIFVPITNFQTSFINQLINLMGVFIFGGCLYLFHPYFNSFVSNISSNKFFKFRYISLFLFYLALVLPWLEIWNNFGLIENRINLGKYFEPITDLRFGIIMTSLLVGTGILIAEITGGSSLKIDEINLISQKTLKNQIFNKLTVIINHIGCVSFGIYLIHMLFVFRVNDTFRDLFLNIFKSQIMAVYLSFFMTCFLSIVTSIFLFLQFEMPVKKWLINMYNKILIKNKLYNIKGIKGDK